MAINIEKGVPLPPSGGGRRSGYPFATMEVGDSFLIDAPRDRVSSAVSYYTAKHGCKFTTRSVDGGIRVWRVA